MQFLGALKAKAHCAQIITLLPCTPARQLYATLGCCSFTLNDLATLKEIDVTDQNGRNVIIHRWNYAKVAAARAIEMSLKSRR